MINYIEVLYKSESRAILYAFNSKDSPTPIFSCVAYVGKHGIDKQHEGDWKTPSGEYGFLFAFGLASKPKTTLNYIQINSNHYWCCDQYHYNQLIDISTISHPCEGEHLIDYPEAYKYAIVLDYNSTCVLNKGSAIFLHCYVPGHNYTAGCISIPEKNLLTILSQCNSTTKILIH